VGVLIFLSTPTAPARRPKVIASPGAHPNCLVTWKRETPLERLVYNRDFVERNFNAVPRVKGILTLCEQDIQPRRHRRKEG
jgi:hypothetical protein